LCQAAWVGAFLLMSDRAAHAASGQIVAGGLGVVPGVEVHPDVAGQRAELAGLVQGGRQRGVMPVRPGQHPVKRDAVPVGHAGALHGLMGMLGQFDRMIRFDLSLAGEDAEAARGAATAAAAIGDVRRG